MNSVYTFDLTEAKKMPSALVSGLWHESHETTFLKTFDLPLMPQMASYPYLLTTMTSIFDPWSNEQSIRDTVVTVPTTVKRILIQNLGWTRIQALETRMRLRTFEEDWDAPGMEGYDDL